eukprot:m.480775 g.480775  ORF g.480775 m.480775 type:complete len:392 (+) comp21947_c0_seq1:414-1589(+)
MADEGRRRTTSFVDPALAGTVEDDWDPLTGAMNGMAVSDQKHHTVKATVGGPDGGQTADVTYTDLAVIGNGSFGVVFKTRLVNDGAAGPWVALKKVLQDRRYKNRELEIMRTVKHCNIVELKYFFFTTGSRDDTYLNLVMEFLPQTLSSFADGYVKRKVAIPSLYIKLSIYQMFRALGYLHGRGICHRDIKPQNLLLNVTTGILKLCDFGCAKQLVSGQPNVSYICSRYYRAPELCLGASIYTHAIDVWSGGCVLGELLLLKPVFQGSTTADQLEKIVKLLGTPSREQVIAMNPKYRGELRRCAAQTYEKLTKGRGEEEKAQLNDLFNGVFDYMPKQRLNSLQVLAHPFFDELRDPATQLPNGSPLPQLFEFSPEEISLDPSLQPRLQPRV